MKKREKVLKTVLLGALAAGPIASLKAAPAYHCKGVAMKWVNDCQANGHDCRSHSSSNFDSQEWLSMDEKDCKAVQKALKNRAVKNYLEMIQKRTVSASKRGKKF